MTIPSGVTKGKSVILAIDSEDSYNVQATIPIAAGAAAEWQAAVVEAPAAGRASHRPDVMRRR